MLQLIPQDNSMTVQKQDARNKREQLSSLTCGYPKVTIGGNKC